MNLILFVNDGNENDLCLINICALSLAIDLSKEYLQGNAKVNDYRHNYSN